MIDVIVAYSHVSQGNGDVPDIAKTTSDVLLETTLQESSNRRRCRGGKRLPLGLVLERGDDGVGKGRAGERRATGQHLVENAAERPHVGTLIDGQAARLLRTHVGGGAQHCAMARCDCRGRSY